MKLFVVACLACWVALSISIPLETTTIEKESDVSTTSKPHSIHERQARPPHPFHPHPFHPHPRHRRDSDMTSTSTTAEVRPSMAEVRPSTPEVPPHSIHARQARQRDSNQHYQHQQHYHQHQNQHRHRRQTGPQNGQPQFPGQPPMGAGSQHPINTGMPNMQHDNTEMTNMQHDNTGMPIMRGPPQPQPTGGQVSPGTSRQLRQVTQSPATTKQPEMTPHLLGGDKGRPPLFLATSTEKRVVRDTSKESSEETHKKDSSEERTTEHTRTRRDNSHSQESKSSEEDKTTETTPSQRHVREVTSDMTTAISTSSATKEGSPHSLPRFPGLRVTETTANSSSETTATPTTTKS